MPDGARILELEQDLLRVQRELIKMRQMPDNYAPTYIQTLMERQTELQNLIDAERRKGKVT